MTAATEGEARRPPPRGLLTIVFYYAKCNGCQFDTRSAKVAQVHVMSQNHDMSVEKRYRLEPPE